MRISTRKIALTLLGIGLLQGVSLPAAAEAVEEMEGDFARGAQAWVANCSRCHNPRDPKEFRDDLWKPVMYHMRIRGGLTGQDTRDILKFLQESN